MKRALALVTFLALAALAQGALKVGVVVSATGPAASLGIPERSVIYKIKIISFLYNLTEVLRYHLMKTF